MRSSTYLRTGVVQSFLLGVRLVKFQLPPARWILVVSTNFLLLSRTNFVFKNILHLLNMHGIIYVTL
ncbi:hypothetical protein BDR03DRAFT_952733 [Suillus americanus]|nr:hypothetical protein BDR03DRAFT_952733 [Suillus americanus]